MTPNLTYGGLLARDADYNEPMAGEHPTATIPSHRHGRVEAHGTLQPPPEGEGFNPPSNRQ
jgi:hypothetical protein